MNETLTLTLAGLAGAGLGAIFFGGLWWTVRRGVSSRHPALWFLGSGLVRTSAAVAGFYFIGGGLWQRIAAALVGFIVVRFVVMGLTRPARETHPPPQKEVRHAP